MQNKMTDYGVLVFPKLNWRQILGCDMTAFVYARLRDGWQKKEIEKAIFDASRECGMDEKTLKGRIEIGVRARMAEFNRRL